MIRRHEPDTLWVITQAAHAFISGQIAQHWAGNGNMQCAPHEELCIAATFHDAGWAAVDETPRINGRGQPRTFTEMDLEEHFDIWRSSIQAVFLQNRYAGLLTSLHCTALYEQRLRMVPDTPETRARIQSFLDTQHGWEQTLIDVLCNHPRYALAVQPDQLAENLRLLQVWDYLSLLVCMSPMREESIDDVPLNSGQRGTLRLASGGQHGMTLDPFPLDGPLTVWIDARRVRSAPFNSDSELREALSRTRYRPLAFTFEPV